MILFRKHYIQDSETKKKCRVYYSLDHRIDGKKCITLYAKSYRDEMDGIIDFNNDSNYMTDYFEKDSAVLFEDHPQYQEARNFVETMRK
jgi:hypothetical protein